MQTPESRCIKIQTQLDLIAEALQRRSPSARKYRKGLTKILLGIEVEHREAIKNLKTKSANEAELDVAQKKSLNKHSELNSMLQDLKQGSTAQSLKEKAQAVDEMNAQIQALTKQRDELQLELRNLTSLHNARIQRVELAVKQLPSLKELEETKQQILSRRADIKTEIEQRSREADAAKSGAELWQQCLVVLDQLDEEIQAIRPPESVAKRTGELLNDAINSLLSKHALAAKNHWGPLIIAIEQELELLKVASSAAQWAESDVSRENPADAHTHDRV